MKSKCSNRRRRNGFTLIELMIVVGIIGILASIAIPSFDRYMRKAKFSETSTSISHIFRGVAYYYQSATGLGIDFSATDPYVQGMDRCPVWPQDYTHRTLPNGEARFMDPTYPEVWKAIGFIPDGALRYMYYVAALGSEHCNQPEASTGLSVAQAAAAGEATYGGHPMYYIYALGDLDNDKNMSVQIQMVSINRDAQLVRGPRQSSNELE
ncbi:MAG: pilin [Polyangiales bacterium]